MLADSPCQPQKGSLRTVSPVPLRTIPHAVERMQAHLAYASGAGAVTP